MLVVVLAILAASIAALIYAFKFNPSPNWYFFWGGITGIVLISILSPGFFTLQPNEARVLILFGHYKGTVRESGFHWGNPFYANGSQGMQFSAAVAILVAIAVGFINKDERLNLTKIIDALESGGKNVITVAVACSMSYMGGGMAVVTDGSGGDGSQNTEMPPTLYFGSDQYSVCNNFQIEKGRDLSLLDVKGYKQVCVLGARAAQTFFNYTDPVGREMQVNGLPYTVVGVYKEKDPDSQWSMTIGGDLIIAPGVTGGVVLQDVTLSGTIRNLGSAPVEQYASTPGEVPGATTTTPENVPALNWTYITGPDGKKIPYFAGVPVNTFGSGSFYWDASGRRLTYSGTDFTTRFGIDVSAYQNRSITSKTIDWNAAKNDGVEFAFVRIGLRGTSTGGLNADGFYAQNIDGAMERGQRKVTCENYYDGNREITIPLDPLLTPQENAAKYFKRYAKAKTAEKYLKEQMEIARRDVAYLESVLEEIAEAETEQDFNDIRSELKDAGFLRQKGREKRGLQRPAKPREFRTTAGLRVLVGRNNRQNDKLTRDADRRDIWFHTQKIHGSHVILCAGGTAPDQGSIVEAAKIAACAASEPQTACGFWRTASQVPTSWRNTMMTSTSTVFTAVLIVSALLAPMAYAGRRADADDL